MLEEEPAARSGELLELDEPGEPTTKPSDLLEEARPLAGKAAATGSTGSAVELVGSCVSSETATSAAESLILVIFILIKNLDMRVGCCQGSELRESSILFENRK